jgi:hypothetical protein
VDLCCRLIDIGAVLDMLFFILFCLCITSIVHLKLLLQIAGCFIRLTLVEDSVETSAVDAVTGLLVFLTSFSIISLSGLMLSCRDCSLHGRVYRIFSHFRVLCLSVCMCSMISHCRILSLSGCVFRIISHCRKLSLTGCMCRRMS